MSAPCSQVKHAPFFSDWRAKMIEVFRNARVGLGITHSSLVSLVATEFKWCWGRRGRNRDKEEGTAEAV